MFIFFMFQNILKMSSFTLKLCRKSAGVFETYHHLYEKDLGSPEIVDLDPQELRLFNSMERQHVNSHTSLEEWLSIFHQIKSRLGTKETMIDLSKDLVRFLDSKFAQTDIKKRISMPDYLEHLEEIMRAEYRILLSERDEDEDEFNYDMDGIKPEDITFLTKRFLPAAMFFTYSKKHPTSDPKELMEDLFTIGAGSMTVDLFPEITGICLECVGQRLHGEDYKNFTHAEITKANLVIFRAQQADHFFSKIPYYSDSSSEDETEKKNLEDHKLGSNSVSDVSNSPTKFSDTHSLFEFNPFAASSDSDSTSADKCLSSLEVPQSHACNHCGKTFSRQEFVKMHIEIFHSEVTKVVVPRFVSEGEDLMTTFVEDNVEESSPKEKVKKSNVKERLPRQKVKKSLRYLK